MKSGHKIKYTYSFRYWQAFLIPFLVMAIGCIGNGIFPFGDRSFLRNDLYNQYMPFFQAFYDRIWQGEGLSYSFQLGLGSGFSALYGYYLASPTNWLVLFCPRDFIAEFITLSILVKLSLAGVSFAHYLHRHFGKSEIGILFFSSAYALSGYMAAYQWNIMWLDVIVLAPLVLLALEELIEHGKGTKYCLLLAVSIFSNFYLSIMLCIFLVLYFLTLIVWKSWKIIWRRCLTFAFYSLLAGGISAVLLLPVFLALSGNEFHDFNFPDTFKWYMNGLEELSRHCINVTMKLQADHWPNIYCGVAVFLWLPLFLLNRKIGWKDKVSKLILMVVMLLGFACNMLDFIWHGMNYPNSLPGRQGYLYIWLVLVIGYEVYLHLRKVRLPEIVISAIFGYAIVILAWIFTDVEGMNTLTYVLTLIFLSVYLIFLIVHYAWNYPKVRDYIRARKWKVLLKNQYLGVQALVLLFVVVELAANTYLTSIRTVNRTNYMKHFSNSSNAVKWLKEQDNGLYRTEIFERLTKNDSMMWDINTTTIFSSAIPVGVIDFYESVGLGTTSVSYWHQGATPLISALLGVKYMVGKDDSMDNDLYELIYADETGYIYECRYSLPIGFVVSQDLEEEWNLTTYNPVKAQNKLCHLLGVSGDLLVPIDSTKVDDKTYTISTMKDSYVYVSLGKNSISDIKLTKEEYKKEFSQVSFDYLIDVGLIKSGGEAKLEVTEEGEKFKSFIAYELNQRVLKEAIDILSKQTLHVTEHGSDYLKGKIMLKEAGQLVLSIPSEAGWKLYVNGKETPIESFEDAFVSVMLEAGTYEIEMRYETPGFKSGFVISAVCIVLFAFCWYLEKARKRK